MNHRTQDTDTVMAGVLAPYFRLLEDGGAAIASILRRLDLPTDLIATPSVMIPRSSLFALTAQAATYAGVIELGAHAGLELKLDELGPIGLGVQSAVTLHDAGKAASKAVSQTANMGQCWVELRFGHAWFCYRPCPTVSNEACQPELYVLMMLIQFIRLAAEADWCPEHIRVYASPPEIIRQIDELSNAEIIPDKDATAVAFPPSWLGKEVVSASPASAKTDLQYAATRTEAVQHLLQTVLPYSRLPDLGTAAEMLSMGPRTLQRGLTAEGTHYRTLIERANYHHAANLLKRYPEMPLKELAFQVGYSGVNNFTRAFKRVSGVAPGQFRKVNRA